MVRFQRRRMHLHTLAYAWGACTQQQQSECSPYIQIRSPPLEGLASPSSESSEGSAGGSPSVMIQAAGLFTRKSSARRLCVRAKRSACAMEGVS